MATGREVWNRKDAVGLIAGIGAAIGLAVLANLFIVVFHPVEMTRTPAVRFAPPGYVVGIVWVILFGLMGTARWLVLRSEHPAKGRHGLWIWILLAFCAAYPVYTAGLSNLVAGLGGNVATLVLTLYIAYETRSSSRTAAGLLLPIVVWLAFATLLIVEEMQLVTVSAGIADLVARGYPHFSLHYFSLNYFSLHYFSMS